MPAIAVIVGVAGTYAASRSQERASRYATDASREGNTAAMDVETRRINADREWRDQQARDEKELHDAEQRQVEQMWQQSEATRLRNERIDDEDRAYAIGERERIARERAEAEARRAAYVPVDYGPSEIDPRVTARRTLQQNAATTLGGLLNTGTPGYRPATQAPPPPMPGQPINPFLPNPLVRR